MIRIPLNILLAEDDKDYRFLFEQALKELPITTHLATVENWEELMKYLIEHTLSMHRKVGLNASMK